MDTTVLIIFIVEFIMVTILIYLKLFRSGLETGATPTGAEEIALEKEIADSLAYLDTYYWGWF